MNYRFFPESFFQKIDLGVSGSSFTNDRFTDNDGNKTFLGFTKIVPGIRLTLKEKTPRSTFHRYLQFRSFLISEDGLRFYRDTVCLLYTSRCV